MQAEALVQIVIKTILDTDEHVKSLPRNLDRQEYERIGTLADWSGRDVLSHINFWNGNMIKRVECAARGEAPLPIDNFNEVNDQVQQANCEKTWAVLLQEYEDISAGLLEKIKTLPPEVLTDEERFEWLKHHSLLSNIYSTVVFHTEWHLVDYHLKHGNKTKAVADYETTSLHELGLPGWEANAWYNLACIFSLAGETGKVWIPLRKAFEVNGNLKQLAVQDADLAAIHEDPQFKAMLAE